MTDTDRPNFAQNVPNNALTVGYNFGRTKKGKFYIWEKGGKWYWQAVGNSGEAPTERAAHDAATDWIRNDRDPLMKNEEFN